MPSPTGRHRLPTPGRPGRVPVFAAVAGTALILGAALVLPVADRTADPIDAAPVPAFAVVVSAPACTADPSLAVVDLLDAAGPVPARLDACGLPAGRRVAVEYRQGDPSFLRLAGTSTAGAAAAAGRWVAAGLAVLALLTVLLAVGVLGGRRRPTHAVVTVPELIARLALPPVSRPMGARVAEPAGHR